MKRKGMTKHQPSKTKQHKNEPKIISLRELQEQEKSLDLEEQGCFGKNYKFQITTDC